MRAPAASLGLLLALSALRCAGNAAASPPRPRAQSCCLGPKSRAAAASCSWRGWEAPGGPSPARVPFASSPVPAALRILLGLREPQAGLPGFPSSPSGAPGLGGTVCVYGGDVVAQHPWTSVLLPGHLRGLEVVLAGVVWLVRCPSRARLPPVSSLPKPPTPPSVSRRQPGDPTVRPLEAQVALEPWPVDRQDPGAWSSSPGSRWHLVMSNVSVFKALAPVSGIRAAVAQSPRMGKSE